MKQKIIIESYNKKEKNKTKKIVGLFVTAALAIGAVSYYYQDKDDDNNQHSGGGGGHGYYGTRSDSAASVNNVGKISNGVKGGIGSSVTSGGVE